MTSRGRLASLARDSLGYGLGSLVGRAGALIMVPVLTRALTPANYGSLDLVLSITMLASMALTLGMDTAVGRFYYDAHTLEGRHTVLRVALVSQVSFATACTLLLIATAGSWAGWATGRSGMVLPLQFGLLSVPVIVVLGTVSTYLRCEFRIFSFNLLAIAQLFVLTAMNIAAVRVRPGNLDAVVASSTIGYGVMLVVAAVMIGRDAVGGLRRASLWPMLRYGVPLVPASVALWSMSVTARFAVAHLRSLDEVALLGVATRLSTVLVLAAVAFQAAWGPWALSVMRQEDAPELYSRILSLVLVYGTALAAIISTLARPALAIFATRTYQEADVLVCWITLAGVSSVAYQVTCIAPTIIKRPGIVSVAVFGAASVNLVTVVPLTISFGVEGAAIASLLGFFVSALIPAYLSRKLYPIPYSLRDMGWPVALMIAVALLGSHSIGPTLLTDVGLRSALVGVSLLTILVWSYQRGLLTTTSIGLRPRPGP